MKTILILLDTVKKDMLKVYNEKSEVLTPNIESLSNDSNIFENHCTGSLPCMPARRDLFTGRLDFFDRFWGPVEPFDTLLQKELSLHNIPTHIFTDHAHYWRHGGEGYLQYFDTYIMCRGQESDPYISHIDQSNIPSPVHGRDNLQYYKNSSTFVEEKDFPGSKTFDQACDFIKLHKDDENFFLQIEGFDPHEPFDAPDEFFEIYNLSDIKKYYNAPKYGKLEDTKEELDHLITKYKANLSFADYNVGKVIKLLKDLNIYEECNIIFTSDHGFHLGEHGVLGKGITHVYNEVFDIPLLHKLPNQKEAKRHNVLTQNIDVMPTLIDMYDIKEDYNFHGKSYLSLLNDGDYEKRKDVVSAYFGGSLTYKDDQYTYLKAKSKDAKESHFTAMPRSIFGFFGSKKLGMPLKHEEIEMGRFLNHTNFPVYKFNFTYPSNTLNSEIYLNNDKLQISNLINEALEKEYDKKVYDKLMELKANEHYFTTFDFK